MPTIPKLRKGYNEEVARFSVTQHVLDDVLLERKSQFAKWGQQNHEPFGWLAILGEEVGEANKAALEARFDGFTNLEEYTTTTDPQNPDSDSDGDNDGSEAQLHPDGPALQRIQERRQLRRLVHIRRHRQEPR